MSVMVSKIPKEREGVRGNPTKRGFCSTIDSGAGCRGSKKRMLDPDAILRLREIMDIFYGPSIRYDPTPNKTNEKN